MIIKFNNNTTVSSILAQVPTSYNMELSTTGLENNMSSNGRNGVQIKVYTEEDLWNENDMFAITLIPAMIFVGILMIVGCVGNALVVYIFGFKFKSATQHSLIVCLACFDLLMSSIAMPSEIADMRYHHTFSSVFACKLLRFITMFSAVSSSLILVVIAVDRHRRVTKPLKRQMTVRHARIWEVVSVCAALLFSWPSLVLTGLRTTETTISGLIGTDCSFSNQFKDTKLPFAHNAVLGIGFVVVITVLAVLYFQIWKTAKYHMSHIFRRPKETLSPTFSDVLKQKGGDFANSSPNASNEIPVNSYINPEKKIVMNDFNDISSSLTSSQGIYTNGVFSKINIDNCEISETKVVKECGKQLLKEDPVELKQAVSRNFELNLKFVHNNNVFNFDIPPLVKRKDLRHFTCRLRAKSFEGNSSNEGFIQRFTTSKLRSVLSSPEIRFDQSCNSDLLFKSASLERWQRISPTNSDKYAVSVTPETITPTRTFLLDFEPPTNKTKERWFEDNTHTIGTSSLTQDEELLMCTYSGKTSQMRKQIILAENDLKPGTKFANSNDQLGRKNSNVASYTQIVNTDIFKNNFISVPISAHFKSGHRSCSKLVLSDMSSDSTNSTSLEELDLTRSNETVCKANNNQECDLEGNCEMTQPLSHILDDCCCKNYIDKAGQTDVAPLDAACVRGTTQQLSHNDVPGLILMDMVKTSRISQLIGQKCKPMAAPLAVMTNERVSFQEDSGKVDCELNESKALHNKIKKPKNISLTRALPPFFSHSPTGETHERDSEDCHLQRSSKSSIFSITNKQGSVYKQNSNGEQQRKISTNSTTTSFKVIRRRSSRQNDKTTMVAFSISSVFVLSFLPYLALMSVRAFLSNFDYNLQGSSLNAYNIFLRFYLLNSAANPLLYGLLNERFRQECKTILFYFCPGSKHRANN